MEGLEGSGVMEFKVWRLRVWGWFRLQNGSASRFRDWGCMSRFQSLGIRHVGHRAQKP